ncbi:MAG: hypothetical protein PHX08_09095 [Lachnospiraceae bacterium]|nr:hypothetical protein [Lachnospiraceae bacterium]
MKSSDASAYAFGWDFQSNEAIMLMLKNIEKVSKVKVEGLSEGFKITLADGKILMSQAHINRPIELYKMSMGRSNVVNCSALLFYGTYLFFLPEFQAYPLFVR